MGAPILKDGMKVQAPKIENLQRFTPGKKYVVRNVRIEETLTVFNTIDDNGEARFCLLEECAHLKSGNWIIVDDYETNGRMSERTAAILFWAMILASGTALFYIIIQIFKGI